MAQQPLRNVCASLLLTLLRPSYTTGLAGLLIVCLFINSLSPFNIMSPPYVWSHLEKGCTCLQTLALGVHEAVRETTGPGEQLLKPGTHCMHGPGHGPATQTRCRWGRDNGFPAKTHPKLCSPRGNKRIRFHHMDRGERKRKQLPLFSLLRHSYLAHY